MLAFALLVFAVLYFWIGGAWHGLLHDQPHRFAPHHDARPLSDPNLTPSVELSPKAESTSASVSDHGIPKVSDDPIHEPHPMLPPHSVTQKPRSMPSKATLPTIQSLQDNP